jgi:hypothetical protein
MRNSLSGCPYCNITMLEVKVPNVSMPPPSPLNSVFQNPPANSAPTVRTETPLSCQARREELEREAPLNQGAAIAWIGHHYILRNSASDISETIQADKNCKWGKCSFCQAQKNLVEILTKASPKLSSRFESKQYRG